MDEFPLAVRVAVPTNTENFRGRAGLSSPHGELTSFRAPAGFIDRIERAAAIIDPALTFNKFVHLAAGRVADAIVKHHEQYLEWARETMQHDGTDKPK